MIYYCSRIDSFFCTLNSIAAWWLGDFKTENINKNRRKRNNFIKSSKAVQFYFVSLTGIHKAFNGCPVNFRIRRPCVVYVTCEWQERCRIVGRTDLWETGRCLRRWQERWRYSQMQELKWEDNMVYMPCQEFSLCVRTNIKLGCVVCFPASVSARRLTIRYNFLVTF